MLVFDSILWYGIYMKKRMYKFAKVSAILLCAYVLLIMVLSLTGVIKDDKASNVKAAQPVQPIKVKSAQQMKADVTPNGLYLSINKTRASHNLQAFSSNDVLNQSAQKKCDDMVKYNYYDHKNPHTGKSGLDFIGSDANASYVSENLNIGYFNTADDVVDSWMHSEAHAASIVDPKYTEIGFATCVVPRYPDQLVVVQHKIEVSKTQPVQNNYYQRSSTPSTTYCTYNDYGGYYNPTSTCRSY